MLDAEQFASRGLAARMYRSLDDVRQDLGFDARTTDRLHHAASWLRACSGDGHLFHCAIHGGYSALKLRSFDASTIDWREDALCPECGINARMRLGLLLLDAACAAIASPDIYLTEQASYLWLAARKRWPNVMGSEFTRDRGRIGLLRQFIRESTGNPKLELRIEDLTSLTFSDRSLDAIGSFDVLEHVPDHRQALAECCRVLRRGGKLVLSAPFGMATDRNILRARLSPGGAIEHLLPPEYHADSISPEGVLCYHHFGWELLEECRAAGFSDVAYVVVWSPAQALFGPHLGMLVAER